MCEPPALTHVCSGIQDARAELAEKGAWVEKLEEDLNAAHEQRAQNGARLQQVALELQVCALSQHRALVCYGD
jgi:hypothetical protein